MKKFKRMTALLLVVAITSLNIYVRPVKTEAAFAAGVAVEMLIPYAIALLVACGMQFNTHTDARSAALKALVNSKIYDEVVLSYVMAQSVIEKVTGVENAIPKAIDFTKSTAINVFNSVKDTFASFFNPAAGSISYSAPVAMDIDDWITNNPNASPSYPSYDPKVGSVSYDSPAAIHVDDFIYNVLEPYLAYAESGRTAGVSYFLSRLVNQPYVTIHKSVQRVASVTEPSGYYYSYKWYFYQSASAFNTPSTGMLTQSETSSHNINARGYINAIEWSTGKGPIYMSFANSPSSVSTSFIGAYAGSDCYYIVYEPITIPDVANTIGFSAVVNPAANVFEDTLGYPSIWSEIERLTGQTLANDDTISIAPVYDASGAVIKDVVVPNTGVIDKPIDGTGTDDKPMAGILTGLLGVLGLLDDIWKAVLDLPKTLTSDFVGSQALDYSGLKLNAQAMTGVFPFCIPFDFAAAVKSLAVAPAAPVFKIDFSGTIFGGYVWELDMSEYESLAAIVRWIVWIGFFFGLMLGTRRFIKW